MSEIVVPGLYLLAGIFAYAAMDHLSAGLRKPLDPAHVVFSGICMLMVPLVISMALGLQAKDVGEFVSALRWWIAFILPVFVLYPWFIAWMQEHGSVNGLPGAESRYPSG